VLATRNQRNIRQAAKEVKMQKLSDPVKAVKKIAQGYVETR
jgi:hypothetical protein